jgi:hypothetical protein
MSCRLSARVTRWSYDEYHIAPPSAPPSKLYELGMSVSAE